MECRRIISDPLEVLIKKEETEMIEPYIGITGFMNREEVEAVLHAFPKTSKRKLMVGVLASSKTLSGQQNKYPDRYPINERIGDIFTADPRVINLIHYNTKETNRLNQQLVKLVEIAGPHLHGFQLNIPWPEIPTLRMFRKSFPEQKIVLQVGQEAMARTSNDPWWIAGTIRSYASAEVIDGVLLDSSGGEGIVSDFSFYRECLNWLKGCRIGLGIAGGLTSRTLYKAREVFQLFPDISVDAQGGLRDNQDRLDIKEATAHVAGALFYHWENYRKKS